MKVGRFHIDVEKRRLMHEGEDMKLGVRAFDILICIVAAGGRLVTRDELLTAVWKGRVVEDNNLDVHLCVIRKKLGPDRSLILTVPRRGYRFATAQIGAEPGGSLSTKDELPQDAKKSRARLEVAINLLLEILDRPVPKSRNALPWSRPQMIALQENQVSPLRFATMRNGRARAKAARAFFAGGSAAGRLRRTRSNPKRWLHRL